MLVAVLIVAVVLIVAAIAVSAMLGARKGREAVTVASLNGVAGHKSYEIDSAGATGAVEVVPAASHPASALFDLDLELGSDEPVPAAPDRADPATPSGSASARSEAASPGPASVAAASGPPAEGLEEGTPAPDAPAGITWARQFDPRSGELDDIARLRLIGDLGVVAKEWCVPLLAKAYEQEQRPANRQAALIALAACRSRTAIPVYRLASSSADQHERAIAADALADLEPAPKKKPRTVVERH